MARVFKGCHAALVPDGALIIVFANKQPMAWGALVAAVIRAGFVVDASWPIKTERAVRTNAISTASLSSSVWLVCRKRPLTARPGYDRPVTRGDALEHR
jgi:putative DNA methylase